MVINAVLNMYWIHGQLMFIKTCFDKEPSHGLINANQQKTEVIDGKLSKSYQLSQLHSRNWRTFFNVVVTNLLSQEDIQEIQDSAPALGGIWLQLLKNSTRILAPLSLAEKNKDVFRFFFPTDKECAKLVGFPSGQSILQWTCTGVIYTYELKTQHPLRPNLKILSPKMLHIANRCFWMLPFATSSDLETVAIRQNILRICVSNSWWSLNGNIQLLTMTRSLVKGSTGDNVENLDQHQH